MAPPHPYEPPPPLPAENGVHVYRTAIVMPIITFCFVAARFYARLVVLKRQITLDDYVVGATMVISIAHAVLMGIAAARHGMGLHVWQYTAELNAEYYLWIGITSELYAVGLAGFKSALLLLYLQTFGLVSRRFRLACHATLFYTLGYLSANCLVEFLGCTPVEKKWWGDAIPGGYCVDRRAANTFFGIGHVTSDLVIALLPLFPIWNLTFSSTRQKVGLSLMLSSGFIAWAVSTVRYVISTYNQFTYDRPWWAGISFAFSILEVNTGLICACVPTLSPLLPKPGKNRKKKKRRTWTLPHMTEEAEERREGRRHDVEEKEAGVGVGVGARVWGIHHHHHHHHHNKYRPSNYENHHSSFNDNYHGHLVPRSRDDDDDDGDSLDSRRSGTEEEKTGIAREIETTQKMKITPAMSAPPPTTFIRFTSPSPTTEMATFSPVQHVPDMPPYDLIGIQALSSIECDKI
ncbi:hypothetical protein F5Y17DRAFT_432836 [Xylariaceae sp. FL0594]|nr:hypothetical protein F5Y17DRAFT_432836 [Xylariaceae sp. FL0594]